MLQGDDNKTLGKFLGENNNHEEHQYRGEDESMWKQESQLRQSVACETGIEIERRKTIKLLCHAL
jgi:hypothetical protein